MNITHAVREEIVGDKLEAIFNRQKELMFKYHDIEKRSGLLQTEDCPVNLDDKRGQARIKDFSWRVMEELGEALDAYSKSDFEHYKEELIDGLHFLVELTILSGTEPKDLMFEKESGNCDMLDTLCIINDFYQEKRTLEQIISLFVMDIGMMCNCLKNKSWKQTNMITDKENFLNQLKLVWSDYITILTSQMNSGIIAETYLRKSQVNKFRQRSGY